MLAQGRAVDYHAPYMEVHMELSKKTTILLSPDLHARLAALARARETSIGELVRTAVVQQYGLVGAQERKAAARRLADLHLPVADTAQMKRESVPAPEEIAR